jgi:hypothetical protein
MPDNIQFVDILQAHDFAIAYPVWETLSQCLSGLPESSIFDASWLKYGCVERKGYLWPRSFPWRGLGSADAVELLKTEVLPRFEGDADLALVYDSGHMQGLRLWPGEPGTSKRVTVETVRVSLEASVNPYSSQQQWRELIERSGSVEAAKKELARQLRIAALIVEAPGYPDVFGCEVFMGEKPCESRIMNTVSVTLSLPWPG